MTSQPQNTREKQKERRGVVAVVRREDRFLVIQRSQWVVAPGAFCFPGGGIEPEETPQEAVVREFLEELGTTLRPVREIWQSVTPWNVRLSWWLGEVPGGDDFVPAPSEVESWRWMTPHEMLAEERLLESNRQFLAALEQGEVDL